MTPQPPDDILIFYGRVKPFRLREFKQGSHGGVVCRVRFDVEKPVLSVDEVSVSDELLPQLIEIVNQFTVPDLIDDVLCRVELLDIHGKARIPFALDRALTIAWQGWQWLTRSPDIELPAPKRHTFSHETPPQHLIEPIVCAFDYLDQSPSAESAGGVYLLCQPIAEPEVVLFTDGVSPLRKRDHFWVPSWANTVEETAHTICQNGLDKFGPVGGLHITLFGALCHPLDSRGRAFNLATRNALVFGLPYALGEIT